MYSSLQDFEKAVNSNNFAIHVRNALFSKTNRSALMSYLQSAKDITAEVINDKKELEFQKIDKFGNTKLMYICAFNKNNISCKNIRALSSDIGCQNKNGVTALMYLCSESNFKTTHLSIFNPEIRKYDINNMTALMYYCRTIHPRKKILFQLSQELEMLDKFGQTALMHFCSTTKSSLIPSYISQIADIFKREIGKQCNVGRTALMRYILNEEVSVEFIKMLSLEIGMRDIEGNTALLIYLFNTTNPRVSVVEALQKEILIKNNNDILPINIAEYKYQSSNCYKYKEIIDFIDQYTAIDRIKNNKQFATIEKDTIIVQKKVRSSVPIEVKSNNSSHKNLFGMRDVHGLSNHILKMSKPTGLIKRETFAKRSSLHK